MNLVEHLRTWDDIPDDDAKAFHWLDVKTAEAADLIEKQSAQIEMLRSAILQFRNERALARAHAVRSTAGYMAMQTAAIDATPDQALEQFAAKVREQCEKACESEYVTEVDADDAVYNSAITYALRAIRAITEIPK